MPPTANENIFELATIQRLKDLGYRHAHGGDLDRALHADVLEGPLRGHLLPRVLSGS